ncbi:MAG TPA: AI-2E family transporter [Salegentibacter sp.]|nr:AI-2E family transporter [Salegentibacter sp.]
MEKFNKKITTGVFITLLLISSFALIIFHPNFFLLVFAGIFLSVLLNFSSSWIVRNTGMKYWLSLLLVILFSVGILYLMISLIGPAIASQVREMSDTLPKSLNNLKEEITDTEVGRELFDELPTEMDELMKNREEILSRVVGSFSSTIGAIANFFIIIITGIFLASTPNIYTKGFISLFPVDFRPRLREVMNKVHTTLSLWMMAKLISMLVVGILTAVGLEILGMPLPYALALIAALFSFIPNIGPYLALAPAVLIGLMEGGNMFIYVIILYFGIQIIESYLITPLIEKKMVQLPPALTLFWMVLLGILTGILGLILATPILAALIVIVNELYVKDNLEAGNELQVEKQQKQQQKLENKKTEKPEEEN